MDTGSILVMLQDKLPKEETLIMDLKHKLDKLSSEEKNEFINQFLLLNLKNPNIGLVLSIALGSLAVDRFYVGDIGLGILKLILSLFFVGIVWVIIDWFKISGRIKKDNYSKIAMIL